MEYINEESERIEIRTEGKWKEGNTLSVEYSFNYGNYITENITVRKDGVHLYIIICGNRYYYKDFV